ncbi:hypothetical protein [Fodinicola acaciae]|uniref:hypothetical protein n=1 Tax=Fodinicola acaciae TaxID=2681555 RepID=UPI001C9E7B59|nr:hypothetical protein [Fodinicola acaciae]
MTLRDQVKAISATIGKEIAFEEATPDGHPDWLVELQAGSVDGPGSLPPADTFWRITGRQPRTFQQWAADHAKDFQS